MALEKLKNQLIKLTLQKGFFDLKKILKVDVKTGKATIMNQRVLITTTHGFANLHGSSEKLAGPAGPAIIRTFGESSGKRDRDFFRRFAPISPEMFLAIFPSIYTSMGWGKFDAKIDLQKGEGFVKLKNSYEAEAILKIYGKKDAPQCFFVAGYLRALFGEMTGMAWEVTETLCEAKGDQYCEFSFKAK